MMRRTLLLVLAIVFPLTVLAQPVINEFVANHVSTDQCEFVEVLGSPSTDYSSYTLVEIEGDASSAGLIDDATVTVGTTDAEGRWWTGYLPSVIENGTITLLLVEGYIGSVGEDIDTDNDGVIDTYDCVFPVSPGIIPPMGICDGGPKDGDSCYSSDDCGFWTSIVDDVAVTDGGTSDHTYASTVLTSTNLPPTGFTVGGASRVPDGMDSDAVSDWARNDFDGEGFPGYPGTLTCIPPGVPSTQPDGPLAVDPDEVANTPAAANPDGPRLPVELVDFIAFVEANVVQLAWETASEENNAGFSVEGRRSQVADRGWESLGFVSGAGTTAEPLEYSFRTRNLEPGTWNFRLKQVDFDGAFEYSPIVEAVVELPGEYALSVAYPNPFNPSTTFTLAVQIAQDVVVTAHDALGRQVRTLFSGGLSANESTVIRFDATGLPSGTYVVRAQGLNFVAHQTMVLTK